MQFKNVPLPTDPEAEELTSLQVHYLNCIDVLSKEFAIFREKAKTVLDTSDELFNKRLDTDPVTLQENLIKTMSIYICPRISACKILRVCRFGLPP